MELVDFDGLFDKKLTEYMKQNGGKRTEKEWEDAIPKLYQKFGDTYLPKYGCTPRQYYARMTDDELISTLCAHLRGGVPVPEFLCAETEKRRPTGQILSLLDSDDEETALYAVHFIGDDSLAFDKYFSVLESGEKSEDVENEVAECLKSAADQVKDRAMASYARYKKQAETASGATGTFTVEISDSTPVIAAVTQYKKNSGALEIAVETYGKEIVSVKLNNRVLQSGEYTYANGKLTIAESVMNSLVAGEYTLEAETVASAAGKIVVSDEPPVFADGEANAVKGSDFVLTVDVKNKTVISVSVDGLPLGEDDYTYENGTLTIKAAVLEEIAAGEKEVEIVTEGGKAVRTFTLSEAPKQEEKKKGCGGSVAAAGAAALSAAIAVAFAAGKKKRDESED